MDRHVKRGRPGGPTMEYTVSGTRTVDDEERAFTAPVEADSLEQAEERFLDQVDEEDFTIDDVQ